MKNKKIYLVLGAVAIVSAMALILHLQGRIPICACGYIKIWHGIVNDSGDSQHLFDWYSFTHVLHGLIIYFALWVIDRKKRLKFGAKLLIAIGIAAGWEILENSAMVINRYRAETFSLNYFGDSIINSIGDVISMSLGFLFSYKMKVRYSIALFIVIELALAYIIRDNLIINIIMLIHPVEAIKLWQQNF